MESGEMNTEILGVALQIVLLIVISYPWESILPRFTKRKDMVGFHEAGREIDL